VAQCQEHPFDNTYAQIFMKTLEHEELYPPGYRTVASVSS